MKYVRKLSDYKDEAKEERTPQGWVRFDVLEFSHVLQE